MIKIQVLQLTPDVFQRDIRGGALQQGMIAVAKEPFKFHENDLCLRRRDGAVFGHHEMRALPKQPHGLLQDVRPFGA